MRVRFPLQRADRARGGRRRAHYSCAARPSREAPYLSKESSGRSMTKKPLPEPKRQNPQPDDQEQSKRFIEAARQIEADESGEAFRRAFRKIVAPKTAYPNPALAAFMRPARGRAVITIRASFSEDHLSAAIVYRSRPMPW